MRKEQTAVQNIEYLFGGKKFIALTPDEEPSINLAKFPTHKKYETNLK